MTTALRTQIATLQRDDRESGRPDEADIVEYIASLGSEPEGVIAALEEKSAEETYERPPGRRPKSPGGSR